MTSSHRTKVFISYSHKDARFLNELLPHLKYLEKNKLIDLWSDDKIDPGDKWKEEIELALASTKIAILLISIDFLISPFIGGDELPQLLTAADAEGVKILPVILRSCTLPKNLSQFQAINNPSRPLAGMKRYEREELWMKMAATIKEIVQESLQNTEQGLTYTQHSRDRSELAFNGRGSKSMVREPRSSPSVFISYSHEDAQFVDRMGTDLDKNGISFWFDRSLRPGTLDWEEAVREQIRIAHAVLLIASPRARRSHYVRDELRVAEMYGKPVYLLWIAGEQWIDSIPLGLGGRQYTDIRDKSKYDETLSKIVAELQEVASNANQLSLKEQDPSKSPMQSQEIREPRNPYKGLLAFTEKDVTDFFGRDALIRDLLRMLDNSLNAEKRGEQPARLLAVVGASGSGKSSVIMAGLLPHLQKRALSDSQSWLYFVPMIPGQHPIEALQTTLSEKMTDRSLKSIKEDLNDASARGLHALVVSCLTQKNRRGDRAVLFIDQFEELFQPSMTESERRHFINLLVTAMTEPRGPLIVILTLRADFYDRPIQYRDFAPILEKQHKLVLPMSLNELRTVIEKPAALPDVQVTFEENLVGDLLFEVQHQAGALPLLEFTLDQLFQLRQGSMLTHQRYKEIGGVSGALLKRAEDIYMGLPSEKHRELARRLFIRLIDPGVTMQDTTRKRALLYELKLSNKADDLLMQETIDAFVTARLLTTNQEAGITTLEVSHEALIREWPRLIEWLNPARDDIMLQQTISRDVAEWERQGRPQDHLYRRARLKKAMEWSTRSKPSEAEARFLKASDTLRRRSRLATAGAVLLLLLLLYPTFLLLTPILHANVYNLSDAGPGSLRYAIENAAAGSTITFDSDLKGSIITYSDIRINKSLTISAPESGTLSIGGSYGIRIGQGVTVKIKNFHFENITLKSDAVIYNSGTTELSNCIFTDNIVSFDFNPDSSTGGTRSLIYNSSSGVLMMNNNNISANIFGQRKTHQGGGPLIDTIRMGGAGGPVLHLIVNSGGNVSLVSSKIMNTISSSPIVNLYPGDNTVISNSFGTLNLNDSEVTGNDSNGIYSSGSSGSSKVHIVNSTISDNAYTGIISNIGNTIVIANSTISNNHAGGISLDSTKAAITNSTITGNGVSGDGGGIRIKAAQASINFCTIYGNNVEYDKSVKPIAGGRGGGIAVMDVHYNNGKVTPAIVTLADSIVANNSAEAKTGIDIFGKVNSDGYNMIQTTDGSTIHNTGNSKDIVGAKLQLGKLQNNGGHTGTLALPASSPAIDRIPFDVCRLTHVTTDQREVNRMHGKGCDIGAYEY